MATIDEVRRIAKDLGLLTAAGNLNSLDSLNLIDLVVALEKRFNINLPPDDLVPERFVSLEGIAELVEQQHTG
jgi:acyl carrier protein